MYYPSKSEQYVRFRLSLSINARSYLLACIVTIEVCCNALPRAREPWLHIPRGDCTLEFEWYLSNLERNGLLPQYQRTI